MTKSQQAILAEGVGITKRLERERFSEPVVTFTIDSQRDEPLTVTLVDELPAGGSPADIDFHREYGSEYWSIDDDALVFERELEPNERVDTLYRLREITADEVAEPLPEPTVETSPTDDGAEAEPEREDRGTADPSSNGSRNGTDRADPAAAEEGASLAVERAVALNGGDGGSPSPDGTGSAAASTDETETAGRAGSTDSLVAALATELEAGTVPQEDVDRLRRSLGESRSGSLVARVEKLQRDVDEVVAYTDALEEFLDENGTGTQLVAEFREEVESFRGEMDEFRSELGETRTAVGEAETRLDGLESSVDDRFGDVESELESIESEIETLHEWRRDLASVMQNL